MHQFRSGASAPGNPATSAAWSWIASILADPQPCVTAVWLIRCVAAATAAGMLISWPLWLTERGYPRVPVWRALWVPGPPWDWIWLAIFLAVCGWLAWRGSGRLPTALMLLLAAWWIAADQSRLQPWFYQYVWMMTLLAWRRGDERSRAGDWLIFPAIRKLASDHSRSAAVHSTGKNVPVPLAARERLQRGDDPRQAASALDACALVMAGTYFWSGWQKFNGGFVYGTYPWLIAPFTGHTVSINGTAVALGWFAGPTEALAGIGLLIPSCRKAAVALLVAMHGLVMLSIGPLGHNWNHVVWPWNLFMVSALALLFVARRHVPGTWRSAIKSWRYWPVILAWWLLPAASFSERWDAYLSSSLYSGATLKAAVEVSAEVHEKLPPPWQRACQPAQQGGYRLPLVEWSLATMHVPAYPARRVLVGVGREVAAYSQEPGDVAIVIEERPAWSSGKRDKTRIEFGYGEEG